MSSASADSDVRLVHPNAHLRGAWLDMAADFANAGEDRYARDLARFGNDFASYVRDIDDQSLGLNLPPQHVRTTTYWLVSRGDADHPRVIGCSRLRHELNDRLREWGCHIGYDVRPADRRKGYGTLQLRLVLDEARRIGLTRVMLTCDATNAASVGVIRNNGGVLDAEYDLERIGARVRRYAIEL